MAAKTFRYAAMSRADLGLIEELVAIADAMKIGKPLLSSQGQAMDGFTALAHFVALAEKARSQLTGPSQAAPTIMQIIQLAEEVERRELGQVDLVRQALARWGCLSPRPIFFSVYTPTEGDAHPDGKWVWASGPKTDWIKVYWLTHWGNSPWRVWLPHWCILDPEDSVNEEISL
jgi:hypothetical protein